MLYSSEQFEGYDTNRPFPGMLKTGDASGRAYGTTGLGYNGLDSLMEPVKEEAVSLMDNFNQGYVPSRYPEGRTTLSQGIINEHEAGRSTLNSLPTSESVLGSDMNFEEVYQAGGAQSLSELFPSSGSQRTQLPLAPFQAQYPNFGEGLDTFMGGAVPQSLQADIFRVHEANAGAGQLSGFKSDLMPVFSGINEEALEPRPFLQSLGYQRKNLYLGGMTELPDTLKISPLDAILSGSNIPTDIVQTPGELAAALELMGKSDGRAAYGQPLPMSKLIEPSQIDVPMGFYDPTEEDL